MGNELGQIIVPFLGEITDLLKKLKEGETQTEKSSNKMTDTFKKATATMSKAALSLTAVGIGAMTTAVGVSINKSLEWGETLDGIGDITGATTEQSAGLALAFQHVGMSGDDFSGAMAKMAMGLTNANGELGPTGQAIADLGISVFDASGNIRPAVDLFQDVADKLGPMPDGLSKTAAMMDIFGKSGKDLGDALGVTANGGLADFNQKANDLGLAFTPEKTEKMIEFNRKMNDFKGTIDGLLVSIGPSFIEILQPVIDKTSEWLQSPEVHKGIENFAKFIVDTLIPRIEDLIGVISDVVGWFGGLSPNAQTFIGVLALVVFYAPTVITTLGSISTAMTALGITSSIALWPIVGILALLAMGWVTLKNNVQNAKTIWDWTVRAFQSGADWIATAINNVLGWFRKLKDSISSLQLPSWLRPGSPPPLYWALLDIGNAMDDLNNGVLPDFNANINASGNAMPVPNVVNNQFSNPNQNEQQPIVVNLDYDALFRAFRDSRLATGIV